MKPRLDQYFKRWIPEAYSYDITNKEIDKEVEDYKILHYLGWFCAKHFGELKASEILKMITSLYESEDLFIQNAIENEFLTVLTFNLGVDNLIEIIKTLPQDLQTVYIKVLLEITKEKKI
ncbi:hypothetical protein [uncultured Proteiniphilum sp.]|uniref:DUF7674 family protein n=1 Tax=uncultured Proteiniphilum sp. TaxID=497637 RepID=UPI00261B8C44|nr:hypothetical protein [uncultured Proteiniphilum sp.]